MSEAATIEIVALADSVLLPLAEKATGLTVKAMRQYIENGLWTEGKEYEVGADGQTRMIVAGFYAWVRSGIRSPAMKCTEQVPEVETQLYRHFGRDGALLYVGISLFSVYRLAQHINGSHWADRITTISIERFASREAAFRAETAAIVNERPLFNIAKVPRPAGGACPT